MKNELLFSLFGICFKKEAISTIRMLRSTKKSRPFMIPHSDKPFSLAKKIFDSTTKPFFLLFCGNKLFCSLSYLSRSNTTPRPPLRGPPPPPWKKASPWPCTSSSSSYPHTHSSSSSGAEVFFLPPTLTLVSPPWRPKEKKVLVLFFCVFPVLRRRQWQQAFLASEVSFPPQSRRCRGGEEKKISTNSGLSFPFSPLFLVFSPPRGEMLEEVRTRLEKKKHTERNILRFLFETER